MNGSARNIAHSILEIALVNVIGAITAYALGLAYVQAVELFWPLGSEATAGLRFARSMVLFLVTLTGFIVGCEMGVVGWEKAKRRFGRVFENT